MGFFKKFFTIFLVVLLFSTSVPEKAAAQSVDLAYVSKEYGLDIVAWNISNLMIKRITAQTVNWINSGFKGSPAYVQNPSQFFKKAADNAFSEFIAENNLEQICSPFRAQVRIALVKNYLSEEDKNYSCSLGIIKNNYDAFMQDFSQGGWDGWFELTQVNGNNPYGAYIEAQTSITNTIAGQQAKYAKQLDWGRGLLSFEGCTPGTEVTAEQSAGLAEEGINIAAGDCFPENKRTVTPGSAIQDQLSKTLGGSLSRLEAADEIDEIIGALMNQLVGRIIGGVGNGLFGASEPGSGSGGGTFTSDLENEQERPPSQNAPGPEIPPCPADEGYPCGALGGGGGGSGSGSGSGTGEGGGGSGSGSGGGLSCGPASVFLKWNESNTWGASGGDGTYSWSAGGLVVTGGGDPGDRIVGYYPDETPVGDYSITVSSGGVSSTCVAHVNN